MVLGFSPARPAETSARQMIQIGYLMWDPLVLREPWDPTPHERAD